MTRTTLQRLAFSDLLRMGFSPIFGGDPDGEDAGKDGDSGRTKTAEDDIDEEDSDADESKTRPRTLAEKLAGVTDEKERRLIEVADESKRRRAKLREKEAEIAALQEKIDKAERKQNSELENKTRDLDAAAERLAKLEGTLRKNLLETAILKFDGATFHDVDMVVKALDLDEIEIDLETGKIEGLPAELRRIVKEKSFLVSGMKKSNKDDKSSDDKVSSGSSGSNPGGSGGGSNDKVAQRKRLMETYPELANR